MARQVEGPTFPLIAEGPQMPGFQAWLGLFASLGHMCFGCKPHPGPASPIPSICPLLQLLSHGGGQGQV